MIQLTIKKNNVQPDYNFRLYKNIVGSKKEQQDENFSNFIQGLCDDNPDAIIDFGVAVSGHELTDVAVADQFGEQGMFDDVEATSNEIIDGLLSNGFLAAKVKMFLNSEKLSIKRMKQAQEIGTLKDSDKTEMEMTIKMTEDSQKIHEKKLSKKSK
ncbi:hypothetical protein M5C72_02775 [Companilactobacillus allii]|uniref:Uncharacterized protein n=1 Tax=Companilactobacillus allii TaxID=1847728 RepID=A0A1P8Q2N4_9LACO|nr:hypothetical protein [Companilactobacillus allii]APX72086.1 hypothetical protein BTM29_05690 [Companilactobacillus allii]USQ69179.1 hypothetical protein M5C72_02775 [Companilactobacillus allii]